MKRSVSVIIPTCNRSTLVTRAIQSVLTQTYTNLECIVVDDASNDNTGEVVNSYDDDRLIFIRHDKKQGASAARNTGIKHSKGDFVAFLDDDDEWLLTKIDKQIDLLSKSKGKVGLVYCWVAYMKNDLVLRKYSPRFKGEIFKEMLDKQAIGNSSTLLVKRKVIDDVGGFDESLPRGNDGDFIRRVCQKYQVDFVPEILVNVHVGHGKERITSNSRKGILNALNGQKIKLQKFSRELDKLPKQKANIYIHIGNHYVELGVFSKALSNYLKAIYLVPYEKYLYKIIFRKLLLTMTNK